jgi:REP element-mobilizing transposase RayT
MRESDRLHTNETVLAEQRRRFLMIEAILDVVARGERDLCEPSVSRIILGNLDWLRGRAWRVWAATLMPSHVHLVLASTGGRGEVLRDDLAQFMSYVGRAVHAAKGKTGGFWQREPFDHWCRDGEAWLRSVTYTVNNPVKAGLCAAWRDWPHTVVDPDVEAVLCGAASS